MTQTTFFPGETSFSKEDIVLLITKPKNKILSKEQLAFNKYSKKIEALRKQLLNDQLRFDKLSACFLKTVSPAREAYNSALTEFVKALYAIYKYEKLTGVNKGKLKNLILSNLDEAFQYIVPTDEIKAIYDALNPQTYDEEEAEQISSMKDGLEQMFRAQFGMDVDFSDMEMNEEAVARKLAEMKDEFENSQKEVNLKRKKTKREIESEIKNKQAQELQNKNVRSIYLSLVKMLHPDLESDAVLKLEREELLKKVTAAYQKKDMHTLLKLESEIIHRQSEHLELLTDEKLKFLNTQLKEQILELQEELSMLRYHPRYEIIEEFMGYSESGALKNISSVAASLTSAQKEIEKDTAELLDKNKMKYISSMLKQITAEDSFENISPSDLMDFFDITEGFAELGSMGKRGSNKVPKKKKQ